MTTRLFPSSSFFTNCLVRRRWKKSNEWVKVFLQVQPEVLVTFLIACLFLSFSPRSSSSQLSSSLLKCNAFDKCLSHFYSLTPIPFLSLCKFFTITTKICCLILSRHVLFTSFSPRSKLIFISSFPLALSNTKLLIISYPFLIIAITIATNVTPCHSLKEKVFMLTDKMSVMLRWGSVYL